MDSLLASMRRGYAAFITSGIELVLVAIGYQIGTEEGWMFCLALLLVVSALAWLSALKRLRAIRDTPTSKIASAAQGYVELIGRGERFGDDPLPGKLSGLPCLWYRYQLERRNSDNKWETEEQGESDASFLLRDETEVCILDPEYAEITTSHQDSWQKGDYRYTESKLLEGDKIYVLGEFRSKNCGLEFDGNAQLIALLAEWKKDMPALLRRFDLNGDGQLDMDEWALARQAAKREIQRMQGEAQSQSDMHMVGRPGDGKLYLISNLSPNKLSQRYLFWVWLHLFIFFAALSGLGWLGY